MKGLDLPVMACAGSGNQGLVATIPVVETAKIVDETAKIVDVSDESLMRALALSYLTTIYIKTYMGILSPVCGCGVAAAVGAGCGIVFLLGGELSQIEAQINNMVGTMAGIICDGAKSGCALGDGVVDTLENLQRIIEAGMSSMNSAIVEVMETKGTTTTGPEE
jgi:L-cysteine desulfidase